MCPHPLKPPATPTDFLDWQLCPQHTTVQGTVGEGCGQSEFAGCGVNERNENCGDKWRKRWRASERQKHLRTSRIVSALETHTASSVKSWPAKPSPSLKNSFTGAPTRVFQMQLRCFALKGFVNPKPLEAARPQWTWQDPSRNSLFSNGGDG